MLFCLTSNMYIYILVCIEVDIRFIKVGSILLGDKVRLKHD